MKISPTQKSEVRPFEPNLGFLTYKILEIFINQSINFFSMKGLLMHETVWSISTTADINSITK
jgi:hypothetical protein